MKETKIQKLMIINHLKDLKNYYKTKSWKLNLIDSYMCFWRTVLTKIYGNHTVTYFIHSHGYVKSIKK